MKWRRISGPSICCCLVGSAERLGVIPSPLGERVRVRAAGLRTRTPFVIAEALTPALSLKREREQERGRAQALLVRLLQTLLKRQHGP